MLHPVFRGIKTPSWAGGEVDVPLVDCHSLEELMQTQYDYDAFTTGYIVVRPDGEYLDQIPRFSSRKSRDAIRQIRQDGGDLLMHAVLIDLDRTPHDPWHTPVEAKRWVDDLFDVMPEAVIYATTRGIRVVFKLRRLVSVENYHKIAKAAMRYVSHAVTAVGAPVVMDDTCQEWDRLARLPYVQRDGRSTGDGAALRMPRMWSGWFPGRSTLDAVEQEISKLVSDVESRDRPVGIPDISEDLERMSEYASLVGPPTIQAAMQSIRAGDRFYEPGQRNTQSWRVVSGMYAFCASRKLLPEPEDMYALVYRSVAASQGTSSQEALSETWHMCERAYARQKAQQEVDAHSRKIALEAARDKTPAVAYRNKGRWIWDPERRTYGQATTDTQTFLADMARTHPLMALSDTGKMLPVHTILRDAGVRVSSIRQILGQSGSRLVQDRDGVHHLEIGVGGIADVPPIYHNECAEYLNVVLGGISDEDGKLFLEWLATSTDLAYPTTALVLRGASGSGKDMIAETLSRIFGGKASFMKSMDRFNAQMLNSALIHLNEGVDPKSKTGPVANRFREIVAGGTIAIEQKGVDPTMIVGNYRIIVTTNNPQPLPVQNTRTLEDFRAIAKRVLHIWMDQSVSDWLEEHGGREYTHDWVDRDLGDRTEPGKFAEHISWLIQNLEVRQHNARFRVPANISSWHVRALLQGTLRDVAYAAGVAATSEAHDRAARVYAGQVFVTADDAITNVVNRLNHTSYDVQEVRAAVREALLDGKPKRLEVSGGGSRVYYPMPNDLVLPLLEPPDRDVFLEEAETYDRLVALIQEST